MPPPRRSEKPLEYIGKIEATSSKKKAIQESLSIYGDGSGLANAVAIVILKSWHKGGHTLNPKPDPCTHLTYMAYDLDKNEKHKSIGKYHAYPEGFYPKGRVEGCEDWTEPNPEPAASLAQMSFRKKSTFPKKSTFSEKSNIPKKSFRSAATDAPQSPAPVADLKPDTRAASILSGFKGNSKRNANMLAGHEPAGRSAKSISSKMLPRAGSRIEQLRNSVGETMAPPIECSYSGSKPLATSNRFGLLSIPDQSPNMGPRSLYVQSATGMGQQIQNNPSEQPSAPNRPAMGPPKPSLQVRVPYSEAFSRHTADPQQRKERIKASWLRKDRPTGAPQKASASTDTNGLSANPSTLDKGTKPTGDTRYIPSHARGQARRPPGEIARTSGELRQHFHKRSAAEMNFTIARQRVEVVAPCHGLRVMLE